jgi:hypothetical protein
MARSRLLRKSKLFLATVVPPQHCADAATVLVTHLLAASQAQQAVGQVAAVCIGGCRVQPLHTIQCCARNLLLLTICISNHVPTAKQTHRTVEVTYLNQSIVVTTA